ncbi:MAG: hypothetical protein M1339_06580, partial [Bacteroidetes bacterium]|nr:hypothetical protein [Bacteroidota bacterium]
MIEAKDNFIIGEAQRSEDRYYSTHFWCLNPVLKLKDLLQRFDEEIGHYNSWSHEWQRTESRINFYLFASAVSCTADDFIFWRPWEGAKVLELFRRFRFAGRLLLRID